ncbi:MAG: hypothetical protein E6J34_21650 [Chloroflexi bacterium]|nr:MAG: hypothetical protein E6J34_21650 [Chloroflexota bacterium]
MIGALVAVINVQAPNHGRARRILSDPDTTQNILHAAYTEGSLTAPKTNDGRHMPEHIRMIKVRSLAEWSDHLPTGNHESEEDNETKNSAFSPLSTGSTCAPCDNPLSDWKDGIPQDIVEEAETDEKRAEEVMLKVMKDNVPEVNSSR